LTAWGNALATGLEKLELQKDLYESMYLALELFRLKVLHYEDFTVKYSGGPSFGNGSSFRLESNCRYG
jgi:Temperature dependent protein affecting M2 dsRNA replication